VQCLPTTGNAYEDISETPQEEVSHQQIKFHLKISWSFLAPTILLEKNSQKICSISWLETIFQMPVYICHG